MTSLTIPELKRVARNFVESNNPMMVPSLYRVTDGKAVGTFVEQAFHLYLQARYTYTPGNAASGIDFTDLLVDVKTTSIAQPQ